MIRAPQNPVKQPSTTPSPRILAVIPARLTSTRLPRKVLREIAGRPMLAWVFEAARACPQLDDVLIATDSEEVAGLCRANAWPVVLTSPHLVSGSDRVHAVAQLAPWSSYDIFVNIQGDEPLLRPDHIGALLAPFTLPHVEVTSLKVLCTPDNLHNPNAVKVVTALDGRALYFSRATIPLERDGGEREASGSQPRNGVWKHIGLYGYRAAALRRFHALAPSPLEITERLEQLRFLENGIPLYVSPTPHDTVGVDTEADLLEVEQILKERASPS